jgi:hypothetical protein
MSWDGSVIRVTGRLSRGWEAGIIFPAGAFPFIHSTGPEAHTGSYAVSIPGSITRIKAEEAWYYLNTSI